MRVSDDLKRCLVLQATKCLATYEHEYRNFRELARTTVAEEAASPRFGFVVRSLWMKYCDHWVEYADVPVSKWRRWMKIHYQDFLRDFDWGSPGNPAWVTRYLIDRTLSVFQPRYAVPLKARHAVDMLVSAGSLQEDGE